MKLVKRCLLSVVILQGILMLAGCGTVRKPDESVVLDWDDLTATRYHYDYTQPKRNPVKTANATSNVTMPPSSPNLGPVLNSLVSGFQMENPIAYEGGVYGKKGHVPVFAASRKDIPDYDRLYWVMVKVLSEKYGCFIKRKQSSANQVAVECRDTRRVVFHRNQGDGWIQFYGRQYDKQGRELVVRNHQAYILE